MFKPIATMLAYVRGTKTPAPQSYDLSAADIAQLRTLKCTPEYAVMLQLIDNMSTFHGEHMLACNATPKVHFLRGYVSALRELPVIIERMTKAADDAAQRIPRDTVQRRAASRRATLYATPSWPG